MKTKTSLNGSDERTWNDLKTLEREVRKEIGDFRGTRFSQAARWLEQTDDLQKRRDALQHELNERFSDGKLLLNPAAVTSDDRPESRPGQGGSESEAAGARGGKARGRECRAAFIAQQAKNGKPLTRVRGALYRNGNGFTVGIAYAMSSKNTWFLGLPAGEFKEAVLLCEATGNKVQAIHLPQSFIEKFGKLLPVSTQFNQAKFNVLHRAGRYYLALKGSGDEDLSDYVVGQPFICPRTEYV